MRPGPPPAYARVMGPSVGAPHHLAARRTRAYSVDALGYLGVAAATIPLGLAVNASIDEPSMPLVLTLSAIPPVVATVWAARQESSRGATWGKRRLGLRVLAVPSDGAADRARKAPSPRRALVRNAAKIGIPWQLGHCVAVGAAFDGFETGDPLTLAATAVTYPLLAAMIGTVWWGSGRGLHDRIARTRVEEAATTDMPAAFAA